MNSKLDANNLLLDLKRESEEDSEDIDAEDKKEFQIVIEDIILLREILILGEYGFRKLQKFFQITEMNVDFQKVPGNSYRLKKIYQQAATDSTQKAPPQVSLLSDFIGAAHGSSKSRT